MAIRHGEATCDICGLPRRIRPYTHPAVIIIIEACDECAEHVDHLRLVRSNA